MDTIEDRLEDALDDLRDAAGCGCCGHPRAYSRAAETIRALFAEAQETTHPSR
jgi:hypothetical protein